MSHTHRFRSVPVILVAVVATIALSAGARAQERRQGGNGSGLPPYNTSTEVTVSGTVAGTETMPMMSGADMLGLTLTVDGQPLHVILGPADYVKKQAFVFTAGAKAEATGMPGLKVRSEPAMIARQVKIGAKTLTLRDASGKPAWEASGQR